MLDKRLMSLVSAVELELREGMYSPSPDFLHRHNVTRDEAHSLFTALSVILCGFLESPEDEKERILMRGVMMTSGFPKDVCEEAIRGVKFKRLQEDLKRVRL